MVYRIRAHHGMCFSFFKGMGYSGAFTENMWAMKKKLAENPEVELLCGVDDVCVRCPNNEGGICISGGKAESYDRQVLERCNLSCGMRIGWNDFEKLVRELMSDVVEREKSCANCQWNEFCKS